MNSFTEQQQTRLMSLIAKYKNANNKSTMIPKISISFCIAVISFTASILSVIFGCLCFSKCETFNIVVTVLIVLLFLIVFILQLLDCFNILSKIHNCSLCRANKKRGLSKKLTVAQQNALHRNDMKQKLIEDLTNEHLKNNSTNLLDFNVMTEEELLDEYVRVFGTEASISVYEELIDILNKLIARMEKNERRMKWFSFIFSFATIIASAAYILPIFCA